MRRLALALAVALPLAAAGPRVADLTWMAGHWAGESDGVEMEEIWLAPAGGLMTGMHRDVKAGRAPFFEFLRIAETKSGVVYVAQPGGRPPTEFPLVEQSAGRVVFANPAHDFPQRITYQLRDAKLCARVEGEGEAPQEWCWSRK